MQTYSLPTLSWYWRIFPTFPCSYYVFQTSGCLDFWLMLLAQVLWILKLLHLPVLHRLPSLSSSRGRFQFAGTPGPIQEPAQQNNTDAEIIVTGRTRLKQLSSSRHGMVVWGWPTEDTIAARQTVQVKKNKTKTKKWGRWIQSSLHQNALFSESNGHRKKKDYSLDNCLWILILKPQSRDFPTIYSTSVSRLSVHMHNCHLLQEGLI